jgi:Family of unknown function (DUF5706)
MKEDFYLHYQFIITRFDQYYNSVTNKGQFYLGINTLMVGAVISLLPKISKYCSIDNWFHFSVICFSICCFFSIVFTLFAIHPFLEKGKPTRSLIFFKSIADLPCEEFIEKFQSQTKVEIKDDLANQIYILSIGLKSKFKNLRYASIFLIGAFIFGFVLIILISKNTSII